MAGDPQAPQLAPCKDQIQVFLRAHGEVLPDLVPILFRVLG